MIFEERKLHKETLERLQKHGVLFKGNAPLLSKEQALVLIGEPMPDKFVKEFVSLWGSEMFADCLLKDYQANEQETVFGTEQSPLVKGNCSEKYNSCRQIKGGYSY
jgi:hypothetical protein